MTEGSPLVYRPWVPQPGMTGIYAHLVKSWGNPNSATHLWPPGVLQGVCERGEAVPITVDPYASRLYRHG